MSATLDIDQLERQLEAIDGATPDASRRKIDLLNDLAWELNDTNLKRAYRLAETAYALASAPGDGATPYRPGMAYSLRTLGYLNQRLGDYPAGMSQLLQAQEICEALALDDGLADVYDGLAGIYYQVGDFSEMLSYASRQLDVAQRISDRRRMANAYNNLANISFETGDYARAIETLTRNLSLAVAIDYPRIECLSHLNLTETYLLEGSYDLALEHALCSLKVSRREGFELFEVYAVDLIGKSYRKLGRPEQAIDYLKQALAASRKVETSVTEPLILLNLGQAYRDLQQSDRALDYLQQSVAAATAINARSELFKAHQLLAEVYAQRGEAAQALAHFKHYHEFRELVFGEKADQRLKVLQVAHDTATAQNEARLLQLRASQLEQEITGYQQLQESLRDANQGLSRRVDELTLLNRIAHLLGEMTSLPETLDLVCHLLRKAFSAAEVLVALKSPPAGNLHTVAHAAEAPAPQPSSLEAAAARLSTQGGTVLLEERAQHVVLTVALYAYDNAIGLLQICVAQQGGQLTPDAVSLAQTIAGAIATAAANVQLYEREVRSRECLERLNAASQMINGAGLDLPTLYAAIHRAVAHLMPVEAFVISLVEAEERSVAHVYNYDRAGLEVAGLGRAPLEHSFTSFMRRHGPSLRVDDFLEFYERFPEVGFSFFGDGEDTRSGLAASFVTADGLYGLLFAQCYPPGAYTDDDRIILELLAAHAATAIENARRAQQTRRDAVDEERNRLARELHDSVTQSLFSASLIAERLPVAAHKSADEGRQGLELVQQLVRGALAEMRALLVELRPAALAAAPLHEAIDQLTQAFGGRRGIAMTVNLDPAPPLPPAVQVALYRIVQESLSNVFKHARARSATVRMRVEPPVRDHEQPWSGTITIHVHDDGRGFQLAQVGAGSFGIGIMHERAMTIGARLDLVSQPGQGTRLELIWSGIAAQEDGA